MASSMFVLTRLTPRRQGATARFVSAVLSVALIVGACGSSTTSPAPPSGGSSAAPPSTASSTASTASTASSAAASAAGTPLPCQQGGNLRIAFLDPISTLSPIGANDNGTQFSQVAIFDELVEQVPASTKLAPGLAQSWDISPDGLTYTFHLRTAKFSNGDPVTADDVVFSLDNFINATIQPDWNFVVGNVDSFAVVDPSTVRMTMKHVDASILGTLSLPAAGIYPKSVWQQLGDTAFGKAPVGSGPFMLKSWTADQDLILIPNPYYWGPKPHLDSVDFMYIPDPTARALKIESGEADFAESISYDQIAELDSHPGMSVHLEQNRMVGWYVTLNNDFSPLSDKLVRQALNYATPRDVINKLAMYGIGTPSNSMIVQDGPFWDSSVPAYPYDLMKAKALMAQSSEPNGFNLTLAIDGDAVTTTTAEIIQAEWAKIGVNVTIQTESVSVERTNRNNLNYEADLRDPWGYTSDVPDDNEIASMFLGWSPDMKSFFSDYKSAQASQLVAAADATTDNAQRLALYSQLQKLAMDDSPWVTLLHAPGTNAWLDKVQGMESTLTGWWQLQSVCFTS